MGRDNGDQRPELSEMGYPRTLVLFILFAFFFFSLVIEFIIFKKFFPRLPKNFAESNWLPSLPFTSTPKSDNARQ
jgi:hypothetical protein